MVGLFLISLISICSLNTVISNVNVESEDFRNCEISSNLNTKEAISYNDDIYLFTSTYDCTNVIGYLCDNINFFNFEVNQYVDTYFYNQNNGYVQFCTWYDLDIDNWTQSNFRYQLSYVRSTLVSTYYIMGANNHSYPAFNVWFEFKDPQGTTFLNFHTDIFSNMNSLGQFVYYGYAINYSTSDITGGWFVVDRYTDTFAYECFRYNDRYYNYSRGVETAQTDAYNEGYQIGYVDGINTLNDTNTTASTIFNGIFEVGLLPVNVFLTIFNFEVFGINISGIVSALLTISVVIIILRFLLGGKSDDK